MRLSRVSLLLFLFTIGISASSSLYSQSGASSSIALADKLASDDIKMYDLAFYLIEKEMAKYPQDRDKFIVQKAQVYFAQRKTDEGQKLINTIGTTSPAYPFSRLILGIEAVNKGNNKMAIKPLEEYFTFIKTNIPPEGDIAGRAQFLKAAGYLRHAYTKIGNADGAVKATGYLKLLQQQKKTAENETQNKYEQTILSAQATLDSAENMILEGKTGWKTNVNSVLKPLTEVYWSGATAWTAMASIEIARALCMLGRYEDGLKDLKKYLPITKSLDAGYKDANMLYMAPSAKAYYWRGKLLLGVAGKATEDENKIKTYFSAAKSFLRVILKYDTSKCQFTTPAISGFNIAKEELAKLGKVIKLPPNIKMPGSSLNRKRADEMFSREKYNDALPMYMKLLKTPEGRTSKDAPDFLYRSSICYVKSGGILEAMTLASYLGDCFPDNKDFTPVTLLLVGEHFWKDYKKAAPKSAAQKDALENALMMYDVYLKNCPTHEFAPAIAMRVATVYYNEAADMGKAASKMKNGQEKLEKTNEARAAFKNAIPLYQYIVDNYAPTQNGKKSAQLLAWCYTQSRQFVKGAQLFLKFADLETNWEKPKERNMGQVADAKFRASENYIQEATRLEKAAKQLRKDAEKAPKNDTIQKDEKKEEFAEKADDSKKEKVESVKVAEVATVNPKSEEGMLAQADKNDKEAKIFFQKSVENILDLLNKWMAPGGRLANVTDPKAKKKIAAVKIKATGLLGWAYDGAMDQNNAIKAFAAYIQAYPDSKGIPKAMLRLGMLYLGQDKANEAGQVLTTLSAKYPEEGKKALPKLARAMYDIKKYDKSMDAATKIFAGNMEIPVADLRWIAKNLVSCGGTHPKEGALLSQKACQKLEELIKKPVVKDWVGKIKAKKLLDDPKAFKTTFDMLKEQLLFLSATASFWAEDYKATVASLTTLLSNKNSPYFWDGYFLRGAAYLELKEPQKALDDYGQISLALLGVKKGKESLYYKIQCKIGDAYVSDKNYNKAAAAYTNSTMAVMDTGSDEDLPKEVLSPYEQKEKNRWIGYSIYLAACCQKELGKKEEVIAMQDLYRKVYPGGIYKNKMTALPKPEVAIKESKQQQ